MFYTGINGYLTRYITLFFSLSSKLKDTHSEFLEMRLWNKPFQQS